MTEESPLPEGNDESKAEEGDDQEGRGGGHLQGAEGQVNGEEKEKTTTVES